MFHIVIYPNHLKVRLEVAWYMIERYLSVVGVMSSRHFSSSPGVSISILALARETAITSGSLLSKTLAPLSPLSPDSAT